MVYDATVSWAAAPAFVLAARCAAMERPLQEGWGGRTKSVDGDGRVPVVERARWASRSGLKKEQSS